VGRELKGAKMISEDLKDTFEYFEEIYRQKQRYNITWAFKDAQERIDSFMTTTSENCKTSCCSKFEEVLKRGENLSSFRKFSMKAAKRAKWFSRLFGNLHGILTAAEMILSVVLVIVLSALSHRAGAHMESELMGTIVVVLFAFFKVVLERWFVKPAFDEWGWMLYRRSTKNLYDYIVDITRLTRRNDQDILTPVIEFSTTELMKYTETETSAIS